MRFRQMFLRARAWWYLRFATNATIPPDVERYLIALRDRNRLAIEEIERTRQAIVDKGAAEGKTISTEGALKGVLELRAAFDGPDREQYVAELDRFIDEFRKLHGPRIPADEAYAMLKDLEARFGQVE